MHFRVVGKSTEAIGEGTLIDYALRVHGLPVRWQSSIEKWEPGKRFVDRQIKGPYRWWHHTHLFETLGKGTLITDEVEYQVPGGWLGALLAGPFVARNLKSIFEFRYAYIGKHFTVR